MHRLRLTLISQVWKLARRSNVSSELIQLQEDVLRQVLGQIVLANELVRDVEHLAPVQADDRLPRPTDRRRGSAR